MAEIDERMEKQQYEMQTLNEEKQLLEKEYKRIPDPVVSFSYKLIYLLVYTLLFRKKLKNSKSYKRSVMISGMKLKEELMR